MTMTRHNSTLFATFTVCVLLAVPGCSSSPWENSYNGAMLDGSSVNKDRIVVRDVPWVHFEQTQTDLENMRSATDIHKDEWPTDRQIEYKAKLLKGLQVSEAPAGIEVLGNSMFKSTSPVRPNDGELAKFAAKIGATRVVWTSRGLGKRSIVVREPVWSYASGSDFFRDEPDGRRRASTYTESTTTWVPVVIEADETAWVAYFLRIPGDIRSASMGQTR